MRWLQNSLLGQNEEKVMLSLSQNSVQIQPWEIFVKHEPKNKMVAGQNPRRLMRLRSEAQREESLSALLGQASQSDAGAKEAGSAKKGQAPFSSSGEFNIILSTTSYKTPDNLPSSEDVTSSASPVNEIPSDVKPLGGPMSPQLRERLMGKAPLRLVLERVAQFIPPATQPKFWIERLECGHVQEAYPGFCWDQKGHLINTPPTAKRRRCQPCRALELAEQLPPRKPVQSVREIPEKKVGEL